MDSTDYRDSFSYHIPGYHRAVNFSGKVVILWEG
jgi:hypothetical protein